MDPIDTANKFMVGLQGDHLAVLRPPLGLITKADALNLAAYLVMLAEDSPGRFKAVLEAVQNA